MAETDDLRLFFSQTIELCQKYAKGHLPKGAREPLGRWLEGTQNATDDGDFLKSLGDALADLKKQPRVGELLQLELSGVIALQSAALTIPGWPFNDPDEDSSAAAPVKRGSPRRLPARAIRASKSLLGSWREVLKGLVPDWVLGILKVLEELLDIYGPPS